MFRKAQHRETKSAISAEAAREKRVGQFSQLRREDREKLSSRRRENTDRPDNEATANIPSELEIIQYIPQIPSLIDSLSDANPDIVRDSAYRLRQLVSITKNPPFDEVIKLGGANKLTALLSHPDPRISFEAAWCLTNIASGNSDHTKVVVESGAIPPLVALLKHQDHNVRDQAVWALGNIAGERPTYRDIILSHGAMTHLLAIAHTVLRLCMLRNVSWTLSNFCRGRDPQPDFNIVSQALPTLHNMLNFRDDDVITDAAWSLSFLTDDVGDTNLPENHKIEVVIHSGVVSRLIALLSHPNPNIKTPTLRTVGNILTGSNFQTQIVLNANALPPLVALLSNSRRSIRRECAWALSNVAAGARPQVMALIEANAFHALYLATSTADIGIKREIVWVITNAVTRGEPAVLSHIANIGWIPTLLSFLREDDDDLQLCALDGLTHFLYWGHVTKTSREVQGHIQDVNIYAEIVERANGIPLLSSLLNNPNLDIYDRALKLLVRYLDCEANDDDADAQADGAFDNAGDGMIEFQPTQANPDAPQEEFDL